MVDAVLEVKAIKGSEHVPLGTKNSIMFSVNLILDGEVMWTEGEVRLVIDSSEGFPMLELHRPTEEHVKWLQKYTKPSPKRFFGWNNIRTKYDDPGDHMEGTDQDVLILGLSSLEIREIPPLPSSGRFRIPSPAMGVG